MKNNLTFKISLVIFVLLGTNISITQAQTDSAYFYLAGIQQWFYQQPDVFSFKKSDNSEFLITLPNPFIEKIEYKRDGTNYVYFKSNATEVDRNAIIASIMSDPLFEKEFMVITQNFLNSFMSEDHIGTSGKLEVVFKDKNITSAEVDAFAINHFLQLDYSPPYAGGVYIFEALQNSDAEAYNNPKRVLERCAEMWEEDEQIIDIVHPSLRFFKPETIPNDTLYNEMWSHTNNGTLSCFGTQGFANADAKINTVWNLDNEFGTYQGYSGQGVTVGVIDFSGFQYSHPDMDGVFLAGYDAVNDTLFNNDVTGYAVSFPEARHHGHRVAGIIAANLNDTAGIAGVAYNAKIRPCITEGTTDQLVKCIYWLADTMQVDIINMSLGGNVSVSLPYFVGNPNFLTLHEAVEFCENEGRNKKGVVMVAAAGNGGGYNRQYPAIYETVLSVGASTPHDKRKAYGGDGFDDFEIDTLGNIIENGWGSSYTLNLDVVAPGVCIPTTDYYVPGIIGLSSGYTSFGGTSASTPLVSGIAALLLEKDTTLTAKNVRNAIRNGAEKVGGYNYSTTMTVIDSINPGGPYTYVYQASSPKHMEMGYGRVNAYNTVFNTDTTVNLYVDEDVAPLSIQTLNNTASFSLMLNNPVTDILNLSINEKNDYHISIYNVNGKEIMSKKIINDNKLKINIDNYSNGIYFLKVNEVKSQQFVNAKFIKL